MGDELGWGRRFLLCPPTHFAVAYEINPWMSTAVEVDRDRAQAQWEGLAAALEEAGATVEILPPHPSVPDLVFTANAGIVSGRRFVPARFRHPERQPETALNTAWFAAAGFDVHPLAAGVDHEGAGDALPFGGVLVSAYRFRSDVVAHAQISTLLGVAVRSIELVDPRYYHLDISFCPLDSTRALLWPGAWDAYGCTVMAALVPEPLVLEPDEAARFVANSVVVGRTVLMPACPPRVGRQLEAWGFTPVEVDVGEFLKAGGGCRCLTLALDVNL
ncbi:MAG: amidinotransferase [Acidimicrobiales bacterium]